MSCGSANACGTFSPSDEAGAILYTAPAAIPAGASVTVTATSVVNPALSFSAAITIVPPIPIAVTFSGAPASLQVNAQFALRATITNDVSANPQVTWSVTCSGTSCGSFNPATTFSGAATTFTAPGAIPPGNTVTVTATSVTDPSKLASASIAITQQAPMLANGTYVFQAIGTLGIGADVVTGVLTAQDGVITGGEQDALYPEDYPYSTLQPISGGSYSTTPDGNLQITINPGPGNTEVLTGTLTSNRKGFIGGIDGSAVNGTLEPQTSTAALAGGYVVALNAANYYDSSPWIGGILNVDGPGSISGNGSVLDVGEGYLGSAGTQTITTSTVSPPDAFGRVVMQLNPTPGGPLQWLNGPLYVAAYNVDGAHLRLIDVGIPQDSNAVLAELGGVAFAQGPDTDRFNNASVAGTSYVFGAEGRDPQGTLQVAGVVALNADGSTTGTLNWNDLSGKSTQKPLPFSGTYTLEPSGRVTLTNLTDGSTFTYSMHLYLNGSGRGVVLSADANDVFAGEVFQQQAGTFSATSFSGAYGLNASLYALTQTALPAFAEAAGPVAVTANAGVDDVAGYVNTGAGLPDVAISGSFTPTANGVFTGALSGLGSTEPSPFTLYMIDSTQGILVQTGGGGLAFGRVAMTP